ncbi:lipoprotein [Mesoplasma seiffertii]|uniref:lipoprotein n=1 Tax=Mesoplasma seiffertii TaxID=28224 RepID=UPI00047DE848|nr:lipoprotein [Mesoplasma seiffertii]
MKKLLTILSVIGLSVTVATNVVSCNTKNRITENIARIEKKLKLLLHSKPETSEPWEKSKLEKVLSDQKIDKPGGISVEVGTPISPGSVTEFEQKITFIGNAQNNNSYIYSGKITIVYAYGENLPPSKIKITRTDVESSIANLKEFLVGTTFNNKELIYKIFKTSKNMPGAPIEGLIFGEVKNLVITNDETLKNSYKNRETIRFTFEAKVGLKDDEQYEFANDVDNDFRKFEGKLLKPISIEESKVVALTDTLKTASKAWNFLNINNYKSEIKSKVEEITLASGILYDTFAVKKLDESNSTDSQYWKVQIELTLKPNGNLGYEFAGNNFRKVVLSINLLSLSNIDNATLSWKLFEQKNHQMLINPQFINFGKRSQIFLEDQANYLIGENITAKWGKQTANPEPPTDDPWENSNKENTAYYAKMEFVSKLLKSNNVQANHLFVEKYMKYTTAFNYEQDSDLTANDKALFFKENTDNFEAKIKAKLNQIGNLAELQKDTTIITNDTLSGKEYYHMILLTKTNDNQYKTSAKVFRVRLETIKL